MKKFFSTLIVLAVITTAAVAETKMLSVNFAIPLDTVTAKVEAAGASDTSKTNYTSIGFGVSGLNMFNNLIGLYTDVEIGFMQNWKDDTGSIKRKEIKDYYSDFKQFSMNFMIGPAFKIIENDKMLFTAAPAGHWYMNYLSLGNASNTISGGLLGLGGNASFSFFFNDVVGLTAGMDLAFDFLGYGDYKKQSESYSYGGYSVSYSLKYTHFNFTPKFGVSFKF